MMTPYQEYIFKSRYARYIPKLGRRETWDEVVDRYCGFFNVPQATADAFRRMYVVPSMRAFWSAGPALASNHFMAYNCSALPIADAQSFAEIMFILMSGCGVGFSVERQYVSQMPEVPSRLIPEEDPLQVLVVPDTREGWAQSYNELLRNLYAGRILPWDLSKIRPEGAPLLTTGGRASGPGPLDRLFRFTVDKFMEAKGRKLTSIECHDLACTIGDCVVAGGVRRSALISLSNLSDDRMRRAKHGAWWQDEPQRALANNSVAYTEKPDFQSFLAEWLALYESKCGERGIFNRVAAQNKAKNIGRKHDVSFLTNPCSEISLRPYQVCNLSEVIIRPGDDLDALLEKVEHATILGTLQAQLANFPFVRADWRKNQEEERLLGVSLTGITDHHILGRPRQPAIDWLKEMREHAYSTNVTWAEKLGINRAAAITTVKPSGTVSQLCNTSSGIHPRFADYYIRRVTGDRNDPITKRLVEAGVPHDMDQHNNPLFRFPIEAPSSSCLLAHQVTALEQCQLWKMYNDHWAEHSVSCTIYYSQSEFLGLGQWVWDNFDTVTGLSFLPRAEHTYKNAPYEAVSKETHDALKASFPELDLTVQEEDDNTVGAQTLACVGGSCEI